MPLEMPQMDWPPQWHPDDIPPHLRMGHAPPPPQQQPTGPMPHEIFQRIKWSVLDPPSDAQICEVDDQGALQWRPLFSDANQSILEASAIQPPEAHLEIAIEPLQSWWHWQDTDSRHLRPAKVLVENPDERPISVEQFICAIHEYAVPLRQLLLKCMDIDDPENWDKARFYFDMITGGEAGAIPGTLGLTINVVEDPTGEGEECAWIWEDAETRVQNKSAPH